MRWWGLADRMKDGSRVNARDNRGGRYSRPSVAGERAECHHGASAPPIDMDRHDDSGGMYPRSGDHPPVGLPVTWWNVSRRWGSRSGQIDVQSDFYWSATSFAANPTNAWNVNFNNGNVNTNNKDNNNLSWCVR